MSKVIGQYTFKLVHGFCPESYEIYKDNKRIGLITELNSRIKVQVGREIIYEKMINEHKENIKTYLDEIIKVIEKTM